LSLIKQKLSGKGMSA